jgi:hypothetical protein
VVPVCTARPECPGPHWRYRLQDDSGGRLAPQPCHVQDLDDQLNMRVTGDRPARDAARSNFRRATGRGLGNPAGSVRNAFVTEDSGFR